MTKAVGAGVQARTLFERLDLTIPAGTMLALTGPSGSGKSTLLALLRGTRRAGRGRDRRARLAARRARPRRSAPRFRREHLAVVGQQMGLVPFLTAIENVELALALKQLPPDEAAERAATALESVGLGDRLRLSASRLSAGERQRVAVARALAGGPRIVLADEPTARLDEANALTVASLLRRAAEEHGAAVVCATHDTLLAEQADRELSLVGEPLA